MGNAARFDGPTGVAVDNTGNVYVADSNNNRITRGSTGQASAHSFIGTKPLTAGREWHTATLLPNGRVLVAGGYTGGFPNGTYLAAAELYEPASGNWTVTGTLVNPRGRHTAILLLNGKVFVAGGAGSGGILTSAELYDPATGTWAAAAPLNTARAVHSATLLINGQVLVAGGTSDGVNAVASADLYDPATGTWAATGTMTAPRCYPTTTLLHDDRVLAAGGAGSPRNGASLADADLYDPLTGNWSATARMATARQAHTATLLPDGRVLVVGGEDSSGTRLASVELYDTDAGAWKAAAPLANGRKWHTANLLPDGKVLVAGGTGNGGYPPEAELYDPATGKWVTSARLDTPRYWHTGTLLPNGKVLIAGGGTGDDMAFASAELYDSPPGLAVAVAFKELAMLAKGAFHLTFTNTPGLSFQLLATTDLSAAGGNWAVLGAATEFWPGRYVVTDTQAAANSRRFYRVEMVNP